ncbi:MAG: hypothetical protein ACRDTH_05625 [Pseudonocardiaceae bacterium]
MTGRQLMFSGSADTEDAAIVLRDRLRAQVRDNTAARTNVTLGYLLDEWLSGHQVEETTRASGSTTSQRSVLPAIAHEAVTRHGRPGVDTGGGTRVLMSSPPRNWGFSGP